MNAGLYIRNLCRLWTSAECLGNLLGASENEVDTKQYSYFYQTQGDEAL